MKLIWYFVQIFDQYFLIFEQILPIGMFIFVSYFFENISENDACLLMDIINKYDYFGFGEESNRKHVFSYPTFLQKSKTKH